MRADSKAFRNRAIKFDAVDLNLKNGKVKTFRNMTAFTRWFRNPYNRKSVLTIHFWDESFQQWQNLDVY